MDIEPDVIFNLENVVLQAIDTLGVYHTLNNSNNYYHKTSRGNEAVENYEYNRLTKIKRNKQVLALVELKNEQTAYRLVLFDNQNGRDVLQVLKRIQVEDEEYNKDLDYLPIQDDDDGGEVKRRKIEKQKEKRGDSGKRRERARGQGRRIFHVHNCCGSIMVVNGLTTTMCTNESNIQIKSTSRRSRESNFFVSTNSSSSSPSSEISGSHDNTSATLTPKKNREDMQEVLSSKEEKEKSRIYSVDASIWKILLPTCTTTTKNKNKDKNEDANGINKQSTEIRERHSNNNNSDKNHSSNNNCHRDSLVRESKEIFTDYHYQDFVTVYNTFQANYGIEEKNNNNSGDNTNISTNTNTNTNSNTNTIISKDIEEIVESFLSQYLIHRRPRLYHKYLAEPSQSQAFEFFTFSQGIGQVGSAAKRRQKESESESESESKIELKFFSTYKPLLFLLKPQPIMKRMESESVSVKVTENMLTPIDNTTTLAPIYRDNLRNENQEMMRSSKKTKTRRKAKTKTKTKTQIQRGVALTNHNNGDKTIATSIDRKDDKDKEGEKYDDLNNSTSSELSFPAIIEEPLLTLLFANISASVFDDEELKSSDPSLRNFFARRVLELLFSLQNSYKYDEVFRFKLKKISEVNRPRDVKQLYDSSLQSSSSSSCSSCYYQVVDVEFLDN